MKILENKTPQEAEKYFNEGRTIYRDRVCPLMSEIYSKSLEWKKKNVKPEQWKSYPIHEVAISLIYGSL